ncbi:protein kinase, putative [Bodo saltans]|uniref:Protein kinase, putative n=1 Tax=Bodo saltans TaxID=75058 RepID=A0A0S4J8M8_BODSA|nr:protein kinase, putative [Bodo saltans]|eukprot:CUG85710.1 protein kinase, putative [Bodo saltans]
MSASHNSDHSFAASASATLAGITSHIIPKALSSGFFGGLVGQSTPPSATAVVSKVLDKCVRPSLKPPAPAMIQSLVEYCRTGGGCVSDEVLRTAANEIADNPLARSQWLVSQLQSRLLAADSKRVVAKVMLVTHDLLVYGPIDFSAALAPIADSFFNNAAATHRVANGSRPQTSDPTTQLLLYDEATRFFIAHNHALLQFQLRHRSLGNMMCPYAADLLLHVKSYDTLAESMWLSHTRDAFLSCLALANFIMTSVEHSTVTCHCFVFAEVMRRYVADSKRLYFLCSRILHIKIVTEHDVSGMPMEQIRDSYECGKRFFRFTDLLNQFYDHLRALPDATLLDRNWIPAPLQQLSDELLAVIDREMEPFERADAVQVETLEGVLSTQQQQQQQQPPPMDHADAPLPAHSPGAGAHHPVVVGGGHHQPPPQADDDVIETADSFLQEMIYNHFATNSSSEEEISDMINHRNQNHVGGDRRHDARVDMTSFYDTCDTVQMPLAGAALYTVLNNSSVGEPLLPTTAHAATQQQSMPDATSRRFQVLDQVLGRGGFGTVYKAWDDQLGKHAACKEVKLGEQNKLALQELYQEYRMLTSLEHPNIVKVLGFVVHQGHGRIFMEWVPSGSVQTVLQETKRGLRETIVRRYIREALQGLAYLHSRGIVHRDVKPGNMLLNGDGTLKLTDFGTSRTLEHAAETVQTGTVVGTVPYLAPECVRGTYSAASDVWAMGCTALHMITGKAPWANEVADNVALIFKLGSLTSLPIAMLSCSMSADLRHMISSALTIDRHSRPSVEELLKFPVFLESDDAA